MAPKPEHPEQIRDEPPLDKSAVTVQVEPESDGSDEFDEGNYGYHLIDQEPVNHADEDEDEDIDLSHLSIQEQAQALARQAQSTQENLPPNVQQMISESEEKRRLEQAQEVSQVWKEQKEKVGREIEMTQQKVQTIKSIMSNISLPAPSNLPQWMNQDSSTDLSKIVTKVQHGKY